MSQFASHIELPRPHCLQAPSLTCSAFPRHQASFFRVPSSQLSLIPLWFSNNDAAVTDVSQRERGQPRDPRPASTSCGSTRTEAGEAGSAGPQNAAGAAPTARGGQARAGRGPGRLLRSCGCPAAATGSRRRAERWPAQEHAAGKRRAVLTGNTAARLAVAAVPSTTCVQHARLERRSRWTRQHAQWQRRELQPAMRTACAKLNSQPRHDQPHECRRCR